MKVILEYLALNTAWILALAAPMAVLVATLMTFGRLSEDNEIMALKGSGVHLGQIMGPAIVFSIVIAGLLIFFNNTVLPHMNHKARLLSRDIYRKRPDLNVEAGYFIDDLPMYSFIVRGKRGDRYQDVRIFGKDRITTQTSIHAAEGTFSTIQDAILITLFNGEIHELDVKNYQNYRRISFERHQIIIPADDLSLQRRDTASRSDREMTVKMMKEKIGGYEQKIADVKKRINIHLKKEFPDLTSPEKFEQVSSLIRQSIDKIDSELSAQSTQVDKANQKKRTLKMLTQRLKAEYNLISGYERSINRYAVEIHKKFSIPVACIAFILVGAPLGIMAQKGGFITAITFSISFFLIYWVFLIAGEEMADRNLLSPILAMWTPNGVLGAAGIYLTIRASREQRVFFIPLLNRLKRNQDQT